MFCPGPSYYYVIDSPTLTLDIVSDSVTDIFGIPVQEFTLSEFVNRIHPGDMDFMFRCDDIVAHFLKERIEPAAVTQYKITYCLRLRIADGSYHLFLLQTTTVKATPEGALLKVFGAQTDISHLTETSKRSLSLVGLQGQPSYLDIDVYAENVFEDFTPYTYPKAENPFSPRETDVARLLVQGQSTEAIAVGLNISAQTVSTHRKNLLRKAAVRNTAELIAVCVRNGYV